MRNIIKTTLSIVIFASVMFYGCSKKDSTTPATTDNSGSTVSITVSDAAGALAAITSVSYTTVAGYTIPVTVNTATGVFFSTPGSSTYVDAGSITLNSNSLTKQSNNAYVYQNLTSPLTFPPVTWNVAGSGSVPSFNYTDDRPMPTFSGYDALPSTVTKASGVTIALGSAVLDADSVYVVLHDYSNKTLLKRVAGNAASVTFTATELSAFTTGNGMVQVAPWNLKSEDFSSKKFYFINETCYTKMGIAIN